ncbi:hypothetical protein [Aureimonas phyllosphaerae]|uniref:Uncharacterized protein n=1 Tax=Aureimonas phyllosphaerae TaxID=1166078 RepID=A0A7W6BLH4_9HYPH|nr:hypothetical protein [Aureimonas phyllosphaerae]MBB3934071.1 hypothetical protein [Aureimonas phyllosphaerae]MBB3958713.1 hypothetical protein [Aureimonas phyllosphaerae]SFF18317.1 hypothetical protein SAMN05216566_10458 [Aureimonas phyllosphaerae]
MRFKRLVSTALLGLACAPAIAQDMSSGPAHTAGPPAAQDTIFWYPAPSRCTYFTPEGRAAFRFDDPQTWRFAFLVMRETKAETPVERGYVMVDGVLRELEKVRSGADAAQANVTVWRSAGEPRVNVNMTVRETGRSAETVDLAGTRTLIRGDGRREIAVEGNCTG